MSSDFAIEMARMVYAMGMTDKEIHEATHDNSEWMQSQIDAVRADPGKYKPMARFWTLQETVKMFRKPGE